MNDREKLVDLMADIIDFVDWEHLEATADHLIANGVVIQKQGENIIEVIRCKDCKWFNRLGCAVRIVDDSDKPTENDFCSFAERKEVK